MDKEKFGKLVLDNERQLYRIAKSILKNDSDCADAAQEAVTRAFEKLHTLRNDQYAKTWLIRILIHECFRLAKKQRREQETLEKIKRQKNPEDGQKDKYGELYEALIELDSSFRIVLELYYLEGFSVREISELLEIPEGTVKSRLGRGRGKLKKCLCQKERK